MSWKITNGWNKDGWQKSPEHDKAPPPESDPDIQRETRGHPDGEE